MNNQQDFLKRIIEKLETAGISYMITGSLGSSFHGRPRTTNDIDIVIEADDKKLLAFVHSLGDGYYVSEDAARKALLTTATFNIVDYSSGYKADIIVKKKRAFSSEEFERRKPVEMLDENFYIVSAEDSILSKLEWAQKGESERQFHDAVGIAEVQWGNLDIDYLKKWAKELDLVALFERLMKEVQKLQT
jgi:hypothetical protein